MTARWSLTIALLAVLAPWPALHADESPVDDTEPEAHAAPANPPAKQVVDDTQVVDTVTAGSHELPAPSSTEEPPPTVRPLSLLGRNVVPGSFATLHWTPDQSFASIATPVPVLVAHGKKPGPRLCLTAAVHGDELNGIEMVRRLMYDLEPETLSGTLIGVPIVNLEGFRNGSRYLSDRRDLNRHFPGRGTGSAADRVAHSLYDQIIRHCEYLVDLHTGSLKRINQPQLRADLKNPDVLAFAKHFGGMTVLHGRGARGTLRRAAVDDGIMAVTMEAGGPNRLEEEAVSYGVQALETLLENLGMRKARRFWGAPQPVFYESQWIRASQGGILLSEVKLNDKVKKGQILGTVTDPITNTGSAIIAPYDGRILGMAINQVVHAGFAAYRLGEEQTPEEVEAKAEQAQSVKPADGDSPAKTEHPEAPASTAPAAAEKPAATDAGVEDEEPEEPDDRQRD